MLASIRKYEWNPSVGCADSSPDGGAYIASPIRGGAPAGGRGVLLLPWIPGRLNSYISVIKKEGPVIKTPGLPMKSDSGTPSTISITNLLNLVNDSKEIASVVSKDVTEKMGFIRPEIQSISPYLRYSFPAQPRQQGRWTRRKR